MEGPEGSRGFDAVADILSREGRKVADVNEEYYRLAAKDLDDWDNKRVKRFEGEPDGVL